MAGEKLLSNLLKIAEYDTHKKAIPDESSRRNKIHD